VWKYGKIQSAAAEIRRGKKRKKKKKKKNKPQHENIMVCSITYRATIMNTFKNRLESTGPIWAIKALLLSSSTYKYK